MVERLMILKTTPTDGRDSRLMKNDSLNTDDDDSVLSNDQQTNLSESQTSLATTKDQLNLTTPQLQQTPSFEFSNDQDEDPSQVKVKKKKQRRMTDQTSGEKRRSSVKHRPWYTKVDLTKPILFLLFICLIYLMWVKRDVWIPRLLTSNSRIRRLDLTKKDSNDDNHRSSSSISKNSNDKESDEEENDTKEQTDDDNDDDHHNKSDNDDDHNDDDGETIKSKHKKSKAKLNVKARRNKMSFSKDGNERKNRPLKHKLIDDDDDDDDNDDDNNKISPAKDQNDTDDDDDADSPMNHRDHHTNKKERKRSIESITSKSSSKSRPIRQERSKSFTNIVKKSVESKTNLLLSAKEDLIEQMKKLIKSHDRNKNIVKLLSKQTGLNKKKITKLIKEKDYRLITLENVISFLNQYHSTLVIVSK